MKHENIEWLIENDGQITLGQMRPVGCVAMPNDEENTLAMLKRHPGESFTELLERLYAATEGALEDEEYIDETNAP